MSMYASVFRPQSFNMHTGLCSVHSPAAANGTNNRIFPFQRSQEAPPQNMSVPGSVSQLPHNCVSHLISQPTHQCMHATHPSLPLQVTPQHPPHALPPLSLSTSDLEACGPHCARAGPLQLVPVVPCCTGLVARHEGRHQGRVDWPRGLLEPPAGVFVHTLVACMWGYSSNK